jgi:L-threonylcarbamoyladenylate synthase
VSRSDFNTKTTKDTKGARRAPENHNESKRLAARLWRAFVSFVLFVFPLQLLPAWVPAYAGMSGPVGAHGMDSILEAAAALQKGQLVVLPTETVYGLAADAADPGAVARLYEAKGRPRFNPLIAHVTDLGVARRVAHLDERARRLARAFWPGPLTLVAPIADAALVCDLARAGLETVAVRAPAHPIAQAALRAFGRPIVAPSANRSGRPSPTTFADAVAETGAAAALALDGGRCEIGLESTVVALLEGPPRLLRPGAVTRAQIEALIGPLAEAEGDAGRSPGRLARHYAPTAPLRLDADEAGPGEAYLAFGPAPDGSAVFNLSPSRDLAEAAANLFSHLRAADALAPAAIAVAAIPGGGLGEAINDRLRRAAGYVG